MWKIRKIISKGEYNYALVPEHPNVTKNGYVLLHRVIIENHIGRLLTEDEIVHHKDHNKKNNDISNLEVLTKDEHSRIHMYERGKYYVKLKCPWCGKEFETPRNKTHLVKHKTINCTFCSRRCSGSFSSYRQYKGLTEDMKKAITENVICVYIKHGVD